MYQTRSAALRIRMSHVTNEWRAPRALVSRRTYKRGCVTYVTLPLHKGSFIYIHTYIYTCIYICMCIYMKSLNRGCGHLHYIYVYVYMYIYMCYIYTCSSNKGCGHLYKYMCMYIHLCISVYVYMYGVIEPRMRM